MDVMGEVDEFAVAAAAVIARLAAKRGTQLAG